MDLNPGSLLILGFFQLSVSWRGGPPAAVSLCRVFSLFAFPPVSIIIPRESFHGVPVQHVCCEISSLGSGNSGSKNIRVLPRKGCLQLEK